MWIAIFKTAFEFCQFWRDFSLRALRGVLYSRCLTSDPEESLQVIDNSTDGALEMKEGVVSFSNNVYTVSPSESLRPSAVYESPMTVDNHAYEEIRYDESL